MVLKHLTLYQVIFFRKRRKEAKNSPIDLPPVIKDSLPKKAKDSDDEDYMAWKKRDATVPITKPDVAIPSTSYKPNILTKKYLEIFNIRQNEESEPQPIIADGDDGFESLNGYNSSEGDKPDNQKVEKETPNEEKEPIAASKKDLNDVIDSNSDKGRNILEDKSNDPDSDNAVTSSPNTAKRIGVRFGRAWSKDKIAMSCDENFARMKDKKVMKNKCLISIFLAI